MMEQAAAVQEWLADSHTHVYLCGLRGMEKGVLAAMETAVKAGGSDWSDLYGRIKSEHRLHVETY